MSEKIKKFETVSAINSDKSKKKLAKKYDTIRLGIRVTLL
jgi:hypothetical protein